MAIVATPTNRAKEQFAKGAINLETDTLIIILMNSTYVFDRDADDTLADVTADQLATEGGYTQDDKELATKTVTRIDATDRTTMSCDDPTWAAVSPGIGPTGAALIIDTTTPDNTVIGAIDFGTDYTIGAGLSFQLQDILISLT